MLKHVSRAILLFLGFVMALALLTLAACVPDAYAAEPKQAAVSVQVDDDGRIAIIALYNRPCQAPSVLRQGPAGLQDGFVVFDPVGPVEAGTPPDDAVRLCWSQPRPGLVLLSMFRVIDGTEYATDPILVPASQFKVVNLDTL